MSDKDKPKKVYIWTAGCQMNIRDSEAIEGLLLESGFEITEEEKKAEVVLFVTCSVRQHAEDRVWSEIGRFSKFNPKPIIGLIGCMAENYKDNAFKRMPGINLVVGTNNIAEITNLLKVALSQREEKAKTKIRFLAVSRQQRDEFVYQPKFRQDNDNSFVIISEGCDNFCSYCVVPYVRGRLRHRTPENILKEIEGVIKKGITSITLLGQNVDAYKYDGVDFIKLLELVNSLEGLEKFSFITSHPKDVAKNLFEAMAGLEKLKKYLHLPAQSGSDRILQLMKRGYSSSHYLDLVGGYRRALPEAGLTTDIIVGFPGESEDDFEATLDLLKKIRFNSAYIFKYSPRPHAEAGKLKDDVPAPEKERRHKILLETQKRISKELKANK